MSSYENRSFLGRMLMIALQNWCARVGEDISKRE